MKEFIVYYRPKPEHYFIRHVYVNALTKEEALNTARDSLAKGADVFRADENCTWEVTPSSVLFSSSSV